MKQMIPALMVSAVMCVPVLAQETKTQPAPTPAAPAENLSPVEAAIKQMRSAMAEAVKGGQRIAPDQRKAIVDEAFKGVDFSTLGIVDAKKFVASDVAAALASSSFKKAAGDRLAALASGDTDDAARAALYRLSGLSLFGQAAHADIAKAALTHPNLKNITGDDGFFGRIDMISRMDDEVVKPLVPMVQALGTNLPASLKVADISALRGLVTTCLENSTPESNNAFRVAVLAAAKSVNEKTADDAREKKFLNDTVVALDSTFMKVGLINQPAPEMDFIWSSPSLGKEIKHLADLKGKVVVLDFWATWCGPCIASFPKMREMQAHYKNADVVLLGVTSIQGAHYKQNLEPGNKREKIDCKGDEAKELGLMPEFIKDMNVSWSVAFSKQNVFNPEYGIQGIPHVAILDATGKVRFRGLHPGAKHAEIMNHIDTLLSEAKLPVPPRMDKSEAETADPMKK